MRVKQGVFPRGRVGCFLIRLIRRIRLIFMQVKRAIIPGALVELHARGLKRPLDGFWAHGQRRADRLAIFVHGMHSNFYRSAFKKAVMRLWPPAGIDVLSFNNRGYEQETAAEVFEACRHDLDSAIAFAQEQGYRRIVLVGHSTGCQKIVYYEHLRRPPVVEALVIAAPGDDLAIAKRALESRFEQAVGRARRMIREGRGDRPLLIGQKPVFMGFTARRFLSIADPKRIEARLFNFDGPMRELKQIGKPLLVLLPAREEYACLPVKEMARRLKEVGRGKKFDVMIVPRARHNFHPVEEETARRILDWLQSDS